MSTEISHSWDDTILPFQLDKADMRGRVARLDGVLETIINQHAYPLPVAALATEVALLTALIGQTVQLNWKLSVQVHGDGAIRRIAADYFGPTAEAKPAQLRAWASFDAERLQLDAQPFGQLGSGMFAILIDQGTGAQPYQGITPLAGGSLSKCAETYFAQSEQLPTAFQLGLAQELGTDGQALWRSGGIMVQHMPKAGMHVQDEASGDGGLLQATDILSGDASENWNRVTTLLETAELTELVGPHVDPSTLLYRLFNEEGPRVFDVQPVEFGCTCGPDKVRQSLSIYSAKDIATMTTDEGIVTADCQFCGAHYEMDPATLGFEAQDSADA